MFRKFYRTGYASIFGAVKNDRMSRIWVIWAGLLVCMGAGGLGLVFVDKYKDEVQAQANRQRFQAADERYLSLYDQWSRLNPEERSDTPWGTGKYGGDKTREQWLEEQPLRLKGDLADLASGLKEPHPLASLMYGEGWQQEVEKYRHRAEIRDIGLLASSLSVAAGLLVVLGHYSRVVLRRMDSPQQEQGKGKYDAAVHSPLRRPVREGEQTLADKVASTPFLRSPVVSHQTAGQAGAGSGGKRGESAGYFEAAKAVATGSPVGKATESAKAKAPVTPISPGVMQENFAGSGEYTNVATLMSTEPVAGPDSLVELTQEVSAIREFAAQQQDQVKKLQEGYDWTIIKRFCLRVIRCVDNLESRVERLAAQAGDTSTLEEIRDELVFALESSGVEQFAPEAGDTYKGKEKSIEAVRERQETSDDRLKGRIAAVLRPGYQYVVSDNDVKIVRCAQVKLYG